MDAASLCWHTAHRDELRRDEPTAVFTKHFMPDTTWPLRYVYVLIDPEELTLRRLSGNGVTSGEGSGCPNCGPLVAPVGQTSERRTGFGIQG